MPERLAALAVALLLTGGAAHAAGEIPAGVDREAYLEVATTILCDCGCHPQAVHACACGRAAEMRDEMAAALTSGGPGGAAQTAPQVIADYVARYGEKIRIAPTVSGFNLVAWLGPTIGFLLAGTAVFLALRRWRGAPVAESAPAGVPVALDPVYVMRLRDELRQDDER